MSSTIYNYIQNNGFETTVRMLERNKLTDGLNNGVFEQSKILQIIKKLKDGSSGGPDGIKPICVEKLANELVAPLSYVFEVLFHSGYVPVDWRHAHVIPVYKQGGACLPSNYRPISLTSVFCKIMESVVKDDMLKYLSERNLCYEPSAMCTTLRAYSRTRGPSFR